MKRILNVHLLPELANPHDLAGHTSIVIDVLRASTTITTALACGADKIVPSLTVEEARKLAEQRPGSLLGGERHCRKLPGFAFGNSPAEYTQDRLEGKTLVFTTTNGTKAMTRCIGSARILIGAIVNRQAICDAVREEQRIDILCAGTNGAISLDDVLGAGAIVDRLTLEFDSNRSEPGPHWQLDDGAELARSLWRQEVSTAASTTEIVAALRKSQGGKNLIEIGMQDDLPLAAELDKFPIVPELDKSSWEIR